MTLNALSEQKLKRVKPDLVSVVRRASEICARDFCVVQGNRTQLEQNKLYAQGRTSRGNIVTWTKKSKHIGGGAVDFAALVKGKISWDAKLYPQIAEAFKQAARELHIGIEWGGDWKTKDWGHIQLTPKSSTPTAPTAGIGWTVTDIQNALVKHGFDPGTIDGILGKRTHTAIENFQVDHGLEVTGGADQLTLNELAKPAIQGLISEPYPIAVGTPKWTVDTLMELGLTRLDAITYTANLIWESGGHERSGDHINWAAHGDNNHSHGAGQWNDRADRFDNLQELAAARGKTWDDPATQLQHLVNELKTTEVNAQRRIEAATTLEEKMEAALTFWRPSLPHLDKRIQIAQKLDKEIPDV